MGGRSVGAATAGVGREDQLAAGGKHVLPTCPLPLLQLVTVKDDACVSSYLPATVQRARAAFGLRDGPRCSLCGALDVSPTLIQTVEGFACKPWQVVELTADSGAAAAPPAALAGAAAELVGVPALPACRVKLIWETDAGAAAEVRTAMQALISPSL